MDKLALDMGALRVRLASLIGGATPSEESISFISDLEKLVELWDKNRGKGIRRIIEARMAEVIKSLPVDNVAGLPAWLMTIDPMRLPLATLRALLREKAEEIRSRLPEDQNPDTS
ncbi:MAG: hypothetical protein WC619_03400 [Patescibacteria group bacterium]